MLICTCLWEDIYWEDMGLSYLQRESYSLSVRIVFLLKIKKLRIFSFLQRNYREIQAKILSRRFKEIASKNHIKFSFQIIPFLRFCFPSKHNFVSERQTLVINLVSTISP